MSTDKLIDHKYHIYFIEHDFENNADQSRDCRLFELHTDDGCLVSFDTMTQAKKFFKSTSWSNKYKYYLGTNITKTCIKTFKELTIK